MIFIATIFGRRQVPAGKLLAKQRTCRDLRHTYRQFAAKYACTMTEALKYPSRLRLSLVPNARTRQMSLRCKSHHIVLGDFFWIIQQSTRNAVSSARLYHASRPATGKVSHFALANTKQQFWTRADEFLLTKFDETFCGEGFTSTSLARTN